MTNEEIEQSIKENKVYLTKREKLTHFEIVGVIFIVPLTLIGLHLYDYFKGNSKPFMESEMWIMIVVILIGLLIYKLQTRRLRFKSIETNLTRNELELIIEKVSERLVWLIEKKEDNVVIAVTNPGFFSGSWGERITIMFDKNKVFVNSICDPEKTSSIVSMGRNKKNMKILLDEIEKASR